MPRKLRIPVWIIGALFLFAAGCGDDGAGTSRSNAAQDGLQPDQVTSNAHIYLYAGGHKTTDLLAGEIRQFTTLDSTVATDITVEFFDTTGARISTLKADQGYIREKDKYMATSGSVVVIGRDSVRLETEYLEWVGAKDSIVTDSFVTVYNFGEKGNVLMSYGFQSDPEMRDVTFKRKVSGRLKDVERDTIQ